MREAKEVQEAVAIQWSKSLWQELELEEADLAQLRIEADLVLKQKRQWEAQLEVGLTGLIESFSQGFQELHTEPCRRRKHFGPA